jgi:hypothetical protein
MATQNKTGYLYGCRGLVITKLNADGSMPGPPDRYGIKTAQKASVELQYEEGEKSTLRGGDKVIAIIEQEDVVTGAGFKFTNAKFDAKATEIIAGGTLLTSGEEIIGWEAPKIADQGSRLPFAAEVYVVNYNSRGVVQGYLEITLPFCFGKAPAVEFSDTEWSTPEFEIKAKENPATNASCYRKKFVNDLPAELTS